VHPRTFRLRAIESEPFCFMNRDPAAVLCEFPGNIWVRWLPMSFLDDLDVLAWVATFAAIVVCCSVTFLYFQDWRDQVKIEFDGRGILIMFLGMAFIVGAFSSYSPNANAPRKTVKGIARFVGQSNTRSAHYEYICATSCQQTGGYALSLRNEAARIPHIGSSYVFTYLEHPVGNAFSGISLRVIAISEPDSGRILYQLDLTNHPYRIAAYLLDTALLVSAGLLGVFLDRSQHRGYAEESDLTEEKEEEPKASGPISLGLESKDAS
jgi:hypothetical protein